MLDAIVQASRAEPCGLNNMHNIGARGTNGAITPSEESPAMLSIVAAAAFLCAQEPPPKGPADWKVEVVAKHPDIKFPSVHCFASDGRLFIGEDPMDMDGPVNKPADRILCIHP